MNDYQIIQLFKDEMILLRDEVKSGNDGNQIDYVAIQKEMEVIKDLIQSKQLSSFESKKVLENLNAANGIDNPLLNSASTSVATNINVQNNLNRIQRAGAWIFRIRNGSSPDDSNKKHQLYQLDDLYNDLDKHIKFHKNEYTAYMVIGGLIALGGIGFLFSSTTNFIESINTKTNVSKETIYIFLIVKVLTILFVELVALAFFRYATNGLRYIQMAKNEQIAIKLKDIILKTALSLEDMNIMRTVIQQLFFTDKNFSFDREQSNNKEENLLEKLMKIKNILSLENK